jgi:hypothetical protein
MHDPADPILTGSRTVEHLADHFESLKKAALEFKTRSAVRGRGYFSPAEDEETRHLLVSYWQARGALLEVVQSYRDQPAIPPGDRPAAFVVAFAAAAILVDAARFLREAWDDVPLIKSKLNEPEPHFGIPQDVYDTVQKSLTSPRSQWHLYHAIRYWEESRDKLAETARAMGILPAWQVADRLSHRVRFEPLEAARTRLRHRAIRAALHARRDVIGLALYGMQKLAGSVFSHLTVRPSHQPGLPASVAEALRSLVHPGDVLITRKEYAVTNYFLPGYWPHAALYLGTSDDFDRLALSQHEQVKPRWARLLAEANTDRRRVLEALKDGVQIRSMGSPLASDSVLVLRPRLSEREIATALARGLFHEGKAYDFDFDFTRSDRLVCTEVVYRSYDGVGGIRFQLTRRAGRLTLGAGDLVQMALNEDGFEAVAAFVPADGKDLAVGMDAAKTIRARHAATTDSPLAAGKERST